MKDRFRKWIGSLLAVVLAAGLAPAPAAQADVFTSPGPVEWASGTVKTTRQGLGPAMGTRKTDPLGRAGLLQEPGAACFETWNYSWNDLYWSEDRTKETSQAWKTTAVGYQEKMTFL